MRAKTAIFVVMFKKAESSEMASIGEVFEDFMLFQESLIRGHRVFKEIWTQRLGKILLVNQEAGNTSSLTDTLLLC